MKKTLCIFLFISFNYFAQDNFNSQLLFESNPAEGEFLDVIVEENYIYAIEGSYLKVYEYVNEGTLSFISQINIYTQGTSPAKVLKSGNKLVVLFRSSTFPNNDPGGIKIIEVDVNMNLTFLSNYDLSGFKFDFTLTDKYIFVAAGGSGLFIIDYQNPASPFLSGRYNPGGYSIGNGVIKISVSGNIASVSMASEGLDIIDISNISQPQKLFSIFQNGEFVNASILSEDYLFIFLQNNSSCKIYNISDLSNFIYEASIVTTSSPRDVSIEGNYLFVSEFGTQIIDISNKTNPFHVGFTSKANLNLTHDVKNSKIFTTSFFNDGVNYSRKLAIYSFSNLASKISLNEPTKNICWLSGENRTVEISAYNMNSVKLEVSPDAGSTWQTIINNYPISGFLDNIAFIVPKIHTTQCLLKVSDINNSEIFDVASNPIELKRLRLISPLSGSFENNVEISWETNDLDTVSLFYSLDNGGKWDLIYEKLIDTTSSFQRYYNWQFENLNSTQTCIKIADYNDVQTYEVSPNIIINSKVEISDSLSNSLDFFPLNVGNFWQFKQTNSSGSGGSFSDDYDFIEVTGDTIIKYFNYYIVNWLNGQEVYYRYDSLNNAIVRYMDEEEVLAFKLDSHFGDCWQFENTNREICNEGIFEESIFENLDTVMHLNQYYYCKAFNLGKGIGPVWISIDESYQTIDYRIYDLVYAKICGVEYGEFVTENDNNISLTKEFQLAQNYPNPFNPSTTIKYNVPSSAVISNPSRASGERSPNSEIPNHTSTISVTVRDDHVTLKVYDILGKEVVTLVNEKQSPGNYKVEFDATNLPSGVYFYRLQTDNFIETKKMVLLR
jgi:hypothetical protein